MVTGCALAILTWNGAQSSSLARLSRRSPLVVSADAEPSLPASRRLNTRSGASSRGPARRVGRDVGGGEREDGARVRLAHRGRALRREAPPRRHEALPSRRRRRRIRERRLRGARRVRAGRRRREEAEAGLGDGRRPGPRGPGVVARRERRRRRHRRLRSLPRGFVDEIEILRERSSEAREEENHLRRRRRLVRPLVAGDRGGERRAQALEHTRLRRGRGPLPRAAEGFRRSGRAVRRRGAEAPDAPRRGGIRGADADPAPGRPPAARGERPARGGAHGEREDARVPTPDPRRALRRIGRRGPGKEPRAKRAEGAAAEPREGVGAAVVSRLETARERHRRVAEVRAETEREPRKNHEREHRERANLAHARPRIDPSSDGDEETETGPPRD